jgi:phosphomethylpyrimidine synthase
MTLMEMAKSGKITDEMKLAAELEGCKPEYIRDGLAEGTIILVKNRLRNIAPLAIGKGLRTKVNANIGTSENKCDIQFELEKLNSALEAKADAVMDLSTSGDLKSIRETILKNSPVPVGTVPVYETAVNKAVNNEPMVTMTDEELLMTIEEHARQGVDFVTIHCGIRKFIVDRLAEHPRLMDFVSRGGSFIAEWIFYNQKENPLYERFDDIIEIARSYELVLSLGDGCRPGAIADASDWAQMAELLQIAELVERCRKAGVQAMVEGPGHIPIHQIEMNVRVQKSVCKGAPFYVLGPIVTDIAPGYDHITSAIGGAIAAASGADFLCYVTRTEHLALPSPDDVREGVFAARIAAHAGDIAKGISGAEKWDFEMSSARATVNWERMFALAIDEKLAREIRSKIPASTDEVCSMCGEYCALKKMGEIRRAR